MWQQEIKAQKQNNTLCLSIRLQSIFSTSGTDMLKVDASACKVNIFRYKKANKTALLVLVIIIIDDKEDETRNNTKIGANGTCSLTLTKGTTY
jgi:hypothetical protein